MKCENENETVTFKPKLKATETKRISNPGDITQRLLEVLRQRGERSPFASK